MPTTLSIRLDPHSEISAKRQIIEQLRSLLVDGELATGTALPSVRRLAMELGVHFNTVAEAYRELATEGWIELKHGRGALVLPRNTPVISQKAWLGEFQGRLRALVAQMRSAGAPPEEIATELQSVAKAMAPTCVG